jgi:hypothetical protein
VVGVVEQKIDPQTERNLTQNEGCSGQTEKHYQQMVVEQKAMRSGSEEDSYLQLLEVKFVHAPVNVVQRAAGWPVAAPLNHAIAAHWAAVHYLKAIE